MANETACKFNMEGKPLPYYGNTVISFLNDENTQIWKTSNFIHKQMMKLPFANKLAFVPANSFHMTVLNLCREIDRKDGAWPLNLSKDLNFHQIDQKLKEIVDSIEKPTDIIMEVDRCSIAHVMLKPLNEDCERKLQEYRKKLADATGIHHPWHNTFKFHITLNYVLDEFDEQEQKQIDTFCDEMTKLLKNEVKPFYVPEPQFVIFNDMMQYETDLSKRGNLY